MQTTASELVEITPEIQEKANKAKSQIESKLGKSFKTYEVAKCKKSSDVGTIYRMKIDVGDEHIHATIHENLPNEGGNLSLNHAEGGKDCCSEL